MPRATLKVADIFRSFGEAYRRRHRLPLQQHRLMRAIECCRTAALGGHVDRCQHCDYERISYNSCRNRHCPKCQNLAWAEWVQRRKAELLPIEYFHVVFTIPQELNAVVRQNKALLYQLLVDASAATLLTLAADPKHLGARIGFFSVLHTWGQNLLDHPHVHCVVTGGGLSPDGARWIGCRPGFSLPVRVLSRLFRRLLLEGVRRLLTQGRLAFHKALETLPTNLPDLLDRLAKPPFAGPAQVIDYLGRSTHRVALSNHRLLGLEHGRVRFCAKNYRSAGRPKNSTVNLEADEFIRRFLLHTLPPGFARIRHYGLLAGRNKIRLLPLCHRLLAAADLCLPTPADVLAAIAPLAAPAFQCPRCKTGLLLRPRPILRIPRPTAGVNSS
jgi:hypothetical protein